LFDFLQKPCYNIVCKAIYCRKPQIVYCGRCPEPFKGLEIKRFSAGVKLPNKGNDLKSLGSNTVPVQARAAAPKRRQALEPQGLVCLKICTTHRATKSNIMAYTLPK